MILQWRMRASFTHPETDDGTFIPSNFTWTDVTGDLQAFRVRYGHARRIALTTGVCSLLDAETGFTAFDRSLRYPKGRMYLELAFDSGSGFEVYDYFAGWAIGNQIRFSGFGSWWQRRPAGLPGTAVSLGDLLAFALSDQSGDAPSTAYNLPTGTDDVPSVWGAMSLLTGFQGGSVIDMVTAAPHDVARVGEAIVGEARIAGPEGAAGGPAKAFYVPGNAYGEGNPSIQVTGLTGGGYGTDGLFVDDESFYTIVTNRKGAVNSEVEVPGFHGAYPRRVFKMDDNWGGITLGGVADLLSTQPDIYHCRVVGAPVIQPHATFESAQGNDWRLPDLRGTVVALSLSNVAELVTADMMIAAGTTSSVGESAVVGTAVVGKARVGDNA